MTGRIVQYNLVVLGDGGVGKTCLTTQLCLQHFVETYDPTLEDAQRKQVVIDGQPCILEILDTAGQEDYAALREQWIRDNEAFLLVYSISSRSSFNNVRKLHSQILRVKDASAGPIAVMLVGNKSDRIADRDVSTQEGRALAKELHCDFVETSAKTASNVEKAFYDVTRLLRREKLKLEAQFTDTAALGQKVDSFSNPGTACKKAKGWKGKIGRIFHSK